MRYVRRHYRVLSLGELLSEMERPTSVVPAVAITFDDGYRDVFEHAFPILRRYEIPATIFAVAEAIETGTAPWYDRIFLALAIHSKAILTIELDRPTEFSLQGFAARLAATDCIVRWLRTQPDCRRREFCAELNRRLPVPEQRLQGRMLTWEHLRTMQAHGVMCGSHTVSHPVLSRLDRENLLQELCDSRLLLEQQLGRPVTDFAFPFGKPEDCTGVTAAELASCGYRSAATTISGSNRPGANPYALRRVSFGEQPHVALFACQLNDLFLRVADPPAAAPLQGTSRVPPTGAVVPREGR
jgi:peptidoglycan/xylan/chitin deacetylase (PgdA/CDA1 family)